ncbi:hypothetical protein IWQ60_006744 [Tieghemiomyces parasiticus]|uniref:Golgi apparatus membrane protein tvp38 n=1 Tax=Tieghemiomyces parasiticus TaxID=78921 RepID=A0A9W8ABH7_9FUNG|nr:hypothetical protein IWQ60_006744 [Tieghemiomyces parasiticus]
MARAIKRRKAPRHVQSPVKKILAADGVQPTTASAPVPAPASAPAESQGDLSFYQCPLTVIYYFGRFVQTRTLAGLRAFLARRDWVGATLGFAVFLGLIHAWRGPHSATLTYLDGVFVWYTYWVLLGVASSIGLGAGLHTFVLFLGPHIVEVTLTAYRCGHLEFADRGPTAFVCVPGAPAVPVTAWRILHKVVWASLCWGAGTAIGELPPYFMARAAALSGRNNPELEALNALKSGPQQALTLKMQGLVLVYNLLQRLGFIGIFLFASIPNPLFDLAGITCGHFLVPFHTFFTATFLGKSVVKSTIQTVTVIFLFSQGTLDGFLRLAERYSPALRDKLAAAIRRQMDTLQGATPADKPTGAGRWAGTAWNGVIVLMLLYFVVSIMESCATTALEEELAQNRAASAKAVAE